MLVVWQAFPKIGRKVVFIKIMLITVILILFMIISYLYYEKTWSVMKMKKNSKSSIVCYLNYILYENKVPALRASSLAGFSQNEEYFCVMFKSIRGVCGVS